MDEALNQLGAYLADRLGATLTWRVALDELTLEVEPEQLLRTMYHSGDAMRGALRSRSMA